MRGNPLRTLLVVLTVLFVGAGTAGASANWSVTPGGDYEGVGGPTPPPLKCAGTVIRGQFHSGIGGLGTIDEITYNECFAPFAVEISPNLPWSFLGISHVDGITDLRIDGIAATVTGPGCQVTMEGWADATYSNLTGILTVDQHISVTSVDPVDNCLGLISAGDPGSLLSTSYDITPLQIIEPA